MKILYVEDHPAQGEIMRQMLELSGFEVHLAGSGEEGLQKARELVPDIILMDLRMPGIGGLEAIRKMKNDPEMSKIPVIVISAWTSRDNREKALEAGAAKFMAKPVEVKRLVNQINQLVSSS